MKEIDEKASGKDARYQTPSRLDEAQRIIEEYADDLRDIIKKLRRRLN